MYEKREGKMQKSLLEKITNNWIGELIVIALMLLILLVVARNEAINACMPKEYEKCCMSKPFNCGYDFEEECKITAKRVCSDNLFK